MLSYKGSLLPFNTAILSNQDLITGRAVHQFNCGLKKRGLKSLRKWTIITVTLSPVNVYTMLQHGHAGWKNSFAYANPDLTTRNTFDIVRIWVSGHICIPKSKVHCLSTSAELALTSMGLGNPTRVDHWIPDGSAGVTSGMSVAKRLSMLTETTTMGMGEKQSKNNPQKSQNNRNVLNSRLYSSQQVAVEIGAACAFSPSAAWALSGLRFSQRHLPQWKLWCLGRKLKWS